MNWPNPLSPDNPLHVWLNKLMAAAKASEIQSGPTQRKNRTPGGTFLNIDPSPSLSQNKFHPFRIYNVPHPTDSTKDNLTFQVRGGIVGYRPRYVVYNDAGYPNLLTNNYESRFEIYAAGSDGCAGNLDENVTDYYLNRTKGDVLTLADGTMEVIDIGNSGDFGVSNLNHGAIFVLNSANDAASGPAASFWVQITDVTPEDFPTFQIKARMITNDSPSANGRTKAFFPSVRSNIIPIGVVVPKIPTGWGLTPPYSTPQPMEVAQLQHGHIINQYARGAYQEWSSGNEAPFSEIPRFWRGQWTEAEDDSFNGMVYYPGDSVSILVPGDGLTIPDSWAEYMNMEIAVRTTPPPGSGWMQISGLTS